MSVVLLGRTRVLKIRRAVAYRFVDHRDLDARRTSAEAELELNAELAPGIYRAVHGVLPGPPAALTAPEAPDAVDFVVEMRRFDESATLAARIAAGEPDELLAPAIDELGGRLAAFHARAPVDSHAPADPVSAAAAMIARTDVELRELRSLAGHDNQLRLHQIGRRLEAAALTLGDELARRGRDGLVRESHGDLRAEHVVAAHGEPVLVVDRLEYRRDLRTVDVADDLSFLTMDLVALGRAGLAERLEAAYRDAGGAACSPALLALYGARRALVRMKVELLRAGQAGADAAAARERAATMLRTARRLAWQTHGPRVFVICGLSGSGKSALAAELSDVSGIPVWSSDLVRKRLLGIAPTGRAGDAGYTPEVTERVYRDLADAAATRLAAGLPAIVDATFLRRHDRAVLLERAGGRVVFVECDAPEAVVDRRVAERARDPEAVSDAGAAVLARQRAVRESPDELHPGQHVVVPTDQPLSDCVAMLEVELAE